MTLDEAIKYYEKASEHMEQFFGSANSAVECRQLVEWLKELKKLRSGWISVKDRLPEIPKPDEGYCCFLVSDGSLIHMAYYTEDGWLFADNGEMKEMFYEVTHWCDLPDYPNHLKARMICLTGMTLTKQ